MSEKNIKTVQHVNQNNNQSYKFPKYRDTDFRCPHCNVHSKQNWHNICREDISENDIHNIIKSLRISWVEGQYNQYQLNTITANKITIELYNFLVYKFHIKNTKFAFCDNDKCKKFSIWFEGEMIYPLSSTAPLPIEEMPQPVKELYNEAREIFNKSPRGACALLRLAVQFLVKELGENEENLNQAIGNLVKKSLPIRIQKALDTVRVIGNNAVHPGQINIEDNLQKAESLFMLINFICERIITDSQKVDRIFDSLPKDSKENIKKRDSKNKPQVNT